MISELKNAAEKRMIKSIQSFEEDLTKIRAGRASPTLLEDIMVDYYGTPTPMVQCATIIAESALMLTVKPWEKKLIPNIEKAIHTAGLGLNPSNQGDMIRVPLPPLSEERRRELIKQVKAEGENAKVALRNIRRDANGEVKAKLKDKEISEDDARKAEDVIQKLTDAKVKEIENILSKKEADLLEI